MKIIDMTPETESQYFEEFASMMEIDLKIPEPFQFNPLKHHLLFIKEFISIRVPEDKTPDISCLVKELKHIGTSVMDVYTGSLTIKRIIDESALFLKANNLDNETAFSLWTGKRFTDFRIIILSDSSKWMMKYQNNKNRYVHLFPARQSTHSIRVKANTLKSAIMYYILIGKDFISEKDLNLVREKLGLSPVKSTVDAEAIIEMIEVLRI
jgi:hypothetical protein